MEIEKSLKLNMRIEQNNPEKGNTAKRFCFVLISSYSSAIVMKAAWYLHEDKVIDQWDRTEDPLRDPHSHTHLISFFTKKPTIYIGGKTASLQSE